jgi:hypothetical protein
MKEMKIKFISISDERHSAVSLQINFIIDIKVHAASADPSITLSLIDDDNAQPKASSFQSAYRFYGKKAPNIPTEG